MSFQRAQQGHAQLQEVALSGEHRAMALHQVFLVHTSSSQSRWVCQLGVTFYKQYRLITQPAFHLSQISLEKVEVRPRSFPSRRESGLLPLHWHSWPPSGIGPPTARCPEHAFVPVQPTLLLRRGPYAGPSVFPHHSLLAWDRCLVPLLFQALFISEANSCHTEFAGQFWALNALCICSSYGSVARDNKRTSQYFNITS